MSYSTETIGRIRNRVLDPVFAGRVAVPFVGLGLWWVLARLTDTRLVPDPAEVGGYLVSFYESGAMATRLEQTFAALFAAFLISAAFGLLVGVALGLHRPLRKVFEPYVLNLYAVPKIVLLPVFILLFKFSVNQKVAFAFFIAVFPMLIITMDAVRTIDERFLELSRSMNMSRYQLLRHVVVPFILPSLAVGLRLTFSLSFIGVLLSELFGGTTGLGTDLQGAMSQYDVVRMLALILLLVAIAFVGNITFYTAEKHIQRRRGEA